jgi:AcrR family transcriptional regulator
MARIIDKMDERVNETAFRLFAKKGYSGVTMKMVAEDVGISVGTLYNYYSNKQDLFINACKDVFDQTYVALEKMLEKNADSHEFLSMLYDEVVRVRGFTRELLRDKINHEALDEIKEHLMILMRSLFYKAKKTVTSDIPERDKDRTIRLILLTMHDFAREYPEDREGNIDFVCRLANKIG